MRFFVLFIVAVIAVIGLSFFRPPNIDETPNELIISAFTVDNTELTPDEVSSEDASAFNRLKPGEVLCYVGGEHKGRQLLNINFYFEYDGVIDVRADEAQISVNDGATPFYDTPEGHAGRLYTDIGNTNMHVNNSGYMSISFMSMPTPIRCPIFRPRLAR